MVKMTRKRWPALKRGPKRSALITGWYFDGETMEPSSEVVTIPTPLKRGQTTVGKKQFKYITSIEVKR